MTRTSLNEKLHAFYDFRVAPHSFDVATFLVEAERERLDRQLDSIHVVIVSPSNQREYRSYFMPHLDVERARWRLNNIILPSCRLLPSVQTVTVCDDGDLAKWILSQAKNNIFPQGYTLEGPLLACNIGLVVIAANLNKPSQFIEASPQARRYARQWIDARSYGRKCISITLREASYNPEQNSDLTVWAEIAQRLQRAGYFPFVLRDMDKALKDLPPEFKDINSCPEAVFNLELRMALYEESHICAFVSNGPVNACYYNRNVQYLYFQTGNWLNSNPPWHYREGIGVGRTPPFANHFQKWVWRSQDADTFMEEIITMDNQIEQSRADGSYESKLDLNVENREPLEKLAKRFSNFPNTHLNTEHKLMFECIRLCPPDVIEKPDCQNMLGEYYLQLQQFETSKSHYQKAAGAIDSPEIWVQLGIICELQSNDDEAIEFYERALKINQRLSMVHYRMGALAQKNGNMIDATKHFQLSIITGKKDQQVFAKLDELFEGLKQLDKLDQPDLISKSSQAVINFCRLLIKELPR